MRRLGVTCFAAALAALPALAAEFDDDWGEEVRAAREAAKEQAAELRAFDAELEADLREFRDERDRAFVEFLRASWEAASLFEAEARELGPKPRVQPVAPAPPFEKPVAPPAPKPPPPVGRPAPPAERPVPPTAPGPPEPARPPPAPPKPAERAPEAPRPPAPSRPEPAPPAGAPERPRREEVREISFLGAPLRLTWDPHLAGRLARPVTEAAITAFWAHLAAAPSEPLLAQMEAARRDRGLNDWGYAVLAHEVGLSLFGGRADEADLFTWFALTKAGYRARVGYEGDRIHLLLPARQTLYARRFLALDGVRFYDTGFSGAPPEAARLYTYAGSYPRAERALDLDLPAFPATREEPRARVLRFDWNGVPQAVAAEYDEAALRFLSTYPPTELGVYFGAVLDGTTGRSLRRALEPLVRGKGEVEAVNLLLRFVQTAFAYQTDGEQFGAEKYMFPQETLRYPYSDCDDRAVLFARLVRDLLHLPVIGLVYPNHVAAAVLLSADVAGDRVVYGGRTYAVTDPTYANAAAGMAMPQCKGVAPEVIELAPPARPVGRGGEGRPGGAASPP